MPTATKPPLLAVLIDADNISAKYAEAIFEEIASFGDAGIRRIYGDFTGGGPQGWNKEKLAALGILPHQQFANTIGKNASDIALVIDAMDILHTGRFDGFVLVSSDSDFTRLASRIREQGLDVYGMGEHKTPMPFVNVCKRFIYVENLTGETARTEPRAKNGKPAQKEKPVSGKPDGLADPEKLVVRAMNAIDKEAAWIHLGTVGQKIAAIAPDFDCRSYGHPNLSSLLESLKTFEVKRNGGNGVLVKRLEQGR